jgi:hypothetical protein
MLEREIYKANEFRRIWQKIYTRSGIIIEYLIFFNPF